MTTNDKMEFVIELARKAMDTGEFPIAAAVFHGNELLASAYTTENAEGRYLVHADQKALMEADIKKLPIRSRWECELFINLEPCLMCLGMAISSFIGSIYYSVEAISDGAVEFVRKEFEQRAINTSNPWRFPKISVGLMRDQSIQLFREYVERFEGTPGIEWARTVAEM